MSDKERKKKHGLSGTPFYRVWTNMKSRCYYHKDKKFKYYGGRGIIICDRWLDFLKFMDDMYISYLDHKVSNKTTTIDRLDSNGNYCPENCCWATREEQIKMNLPENIDTSKMKEITINITDAQYERLKERAKTIRKSMAAQIRLAIFDSLMLPRIY